MKKHAFACILLILAAVISVGSVTVLGPCVHADGSEAVCSRAGRAILIDGCVLAGMAVLLFFLRTPTGRTAVLFFALCASAVGIALPGTLFPLCRMDSMHCRAVMQPATIILFAAALVVSAAGIISERKKVRRTKS